MLIPTSITYVLQQHCRAEEEGGGGTAVGGALGVMLAECGRYNVGLFQQKCIHFVYITDSLNDGPGQDCC